MAAKPGKKFCIEHGISQRREEENAEEEEGGIGGERTPCPYDPKHTCYVSKLSKHLKKCNSRPKQLPEYINPGLNAKDSEFPNETDEIYSITSFPTESLKAVVQKIEKVFAEERLKCRRSILAHSAVDSALENVNLGMNTKKHLIQNSSLLKNMEEEGFFNDGATFVEFGAGRGQLGFWVTQALEGGENYSLLLIDRASHRHKSDNKLKGVSPVKTLRIRADIADVDLSKISFLCLRDNVYGMTKHLCGVATDLALRCIVNGKFNGVNVRGIAMALCCHHRCTWTSFVGKKFLLGAGFDRREFSALCSISSWATCGSGKPRQRSETEERENDRYRELNWSRETREEIGRKCKMILNHARLKYLEEFGFKGELIYYVEQSISPENVCLMAKYTG